MDAVEKQVEPLPVVEIRRNQAIGMLIVSVVWAATVLVVIALATR
jgi:hypothetical protein